MRVRALACIPVPCLPRAEVSVGEGTSRRADRRVLRTAGRLWSRRRPAPCSAASWDLTDLGDHRLKDWRPHSDLSDGQGFFRRSRRSRTTTSPRPTSPFIGRERELAQIRDQPARGARLLTLTRPGGTGKTRLAIEAAHAPIPRYKSGVFWVGVAASAIPLWLRMQITQTLGARRTASAEHIGEREMLLVVDNLEQVIEAAPEMSQTTAQLPQSDLGVQRPGAADEYRGDRVRGAAAGRQRGGGAVVRAPANAEPEIMQLCAAALTRSHQRPELAAARTKAPTPVQILNRLARRLTSLKGGRDVDPRQQTLQGDDRMDYGAAYRRRKAPLPDASVFAGGLHPRSCRGNMRRRPRHPATAFVDKSLVRFSGERYGMLETIVRQYAGEQLDKLGESEECGCATPGGSQCWSSSPEPSSRVTSRTNGSDLLDREHDNIRAALAYAVDARVDKRRAAAGRWQRNLLVDPRLLERRPALARDGAAHHEPTIRPCCTRPWRRQPTLRLPSGRDDQRARELAVEAVQRAHQPRTLAPLRAASRVLALPSSDEMTFNEQLQRLCPAKCRLRQKGRRPVGPADGAQQSRRSRLQRGDLDRAGRFFDEAPEDRTQPQGSAERSIRAEECRRAGARAWPHR